MRHCGKFRAPDGSIIEMPEQDKRNNETTFQWSKRLDKFWASGVVKNTRCACDPDNPFRPKDEE